jgi:hypothetical protein
MSDYQFLLFTDGDTSSIDIEGARCDISAAIEATAEYAEQIAERLGYSDFKQAEDTDSGYTRLIQVDYINELAVLCHDDPKPHIFTMSRFTGPVEIWVKP